MKKFMSIILAVIMIFTVIPFAGLQLKASAATQLSVTQEQAVSWALNNYQTVTGAYGTNDYVGECISLVKRYIRDGLKIGGSNAFAVPGGCACRMDEVAFICNNFTIIRSGEPRPGDVFVWDPGVHGAAATYGHVGIITSTNGNTYNYVDWSGHKAHSGSTSGYTYLVRPDFAGSDSSPKVNIDKTLNTLYTNTTFSFENVTSASSLHLYIYYGTEKYFEGEFSPNQTYTRVFGKTGHYSCYIVAHYGSSNVESGWLGFDIVENMDDYVPKKPTLYTNTSSVIPNQEVTFYHWSEKANEYTFEIYKNGSKIETKKIYTGTHTETFSDIGSYSFSCYATNSYGNSERAEMTLNVGLYNVKFYLESEEVFQEQKKEYNKNLVLADTVPEKENYIFKEWNTQADGTGTAYQPGDTYSLNEALTLYAVWKPACEHSYTSEITIYPDCTNVGEKTFTCSLCGDTYTEEISVLGHEYKDVITPPTCTEQGYTTHTCSRCDDSYVDTYTDSLNHSSFIWVTSVNPTTTSDGLAEKVCTHCGKVLDQFVIPCLAPTYVTGITLSSESETVGVGDSFTLTATIKPDTAENKNVVWSSRNPEIATVENGIVRAIKPGTTAIVAESEDGGFVKFCLVRVIGLTAKNGSVIDNDKNIIYGLSAHLDNVKNYIGLVDDSMSITFSTSTIGTGTLINVVDNGEIIDSYEAVIFGDVNCDGWYDGTDAVLVRMIAGGMLTREQVGEAVWTAADCNHDGVIDESDVALLEQAGLLLANVDQSKSADELKTDSAYVEYLNLIEQNPADETEPSDTSFFKMIIDFIAYIISKFMMIFA